MAITFGGKKTGVTVEQLQATWDRALRQLDRLEARESLLQRQVEWIARNRDSDRYGEARRKHQQCVDEWYDEMLEEFYRRCAAFGRIARGLDADVLEGIHPYAVHGVAGLHQVRADRARGVPLGQFAATNEPMPF